MLDLSFQCNECGKKFKTVKAAEKAMWNGCPKCNSSDIDVDPGPVAKRKREV